MLALLQWLIFGHVHKWNFLYAINVFDSEKATMKSGEDHVVECDKCGKRKAFRI